MMTVKELLGLDKLKSIELAAGKAGAKRAVTGAVMLDNPEMVDWMREGELLLTTGYVLKENPDLQDDILDALIKNKASPHLGKINGDDKPLHRHPRLIHPSQA